MFKTTFRLGDKCFCICPRSNLNLSVDLNFSVVAEEPESGANSAQRNLECPTPPREFLFHRLHVPDPTNPACSRDSCLPFIRRISAFVSRGRDGRQRHLHGAAHFNHGLLGASGGAERTSVQNLDGLLLGCGGAAVLDRLEYFYQ